MTHRLLVTDLDGTLLGAGGEVGEEDREAIRDLLRRGILVSVLTGRLFSGTRSIVSELGLAGPIACLDGSHLVEAQTGRDLLISRLASEPAEWLRREIELSHTTAVLFTDHQILHDGASLEYLSYLTFWSRHIQPVDNVLDPSHWIIAQTPMAVVGLGAPVRIQTLAQRILEAPEGGLQVTAFGLDAAGLHGLWGMLVRAGGTDKGTALQWVARHHGIRTDEVVAVGDWLNDIPMLKAAGRSFAMAQASREVQAAATDVLRASVHTGGGIAEAARRSGLL